ncbi:MAG: hypothetical protein JWR24_2860 [Actinoallomurus sp.]|nr:hypothetical protein [Actinoallomurus sp.]
MPDLVSTIVAKALVMLIEALLTRLFLQLTRSGLYRAPRTAGMAAA